MTKRHKSQISFEFLAVLTISLALLASGLYLMLDYTRQSSNTIVDYQINQIGSLLADTAATVNEYGKDAKVVVDTEFPDKITNMTIMNNSILAISVYFMGNENTYIFPCGFNITGTFVPDDWQQGKKRFEVLSMGNYTRIKRI
jgi:hypothetical protein